MHRARRVRARVADDGARAHGQARVDDHIPVVLEVEVLPIGSAHDALPGIEAFALSDRAAVGLPLPGVARGRCGQEGGEEARREEARPGPHSALSRVHIIFVHTNRALCKVSMDLKEICGTS